MYFDCPNELALCYAKRFETISVMFLIFCACVLYRICTPSVLSDHAIYKPKMSRKEIFRNHCRTNHNIFGINTKYLGLVFCVEFERITVFCTQVIFGC